MDQAVQYDPNVMLIKCLGVFLPFWSEGPQLRIRIAAPSHVWSDGTNLYWPFWNFRDRRMLPTEVNFTSLEKFAALADAPPEKILQFASKWGVLGICRPHGLPHSAGPGCIPRLVGRAEDGSLIEISEDDPYDYLYVFETELISEWRRYARQFRSILNVVGALNAGRLGDKSDWAVIMDGYRTSRDHVDPDFDNPARPDFDESDARYIICERIGDYVKIAHFRYELGFEKRRFRISLHGDDFYRLFAALSLLLMSAAGSADAFVTCSACGNPYRPPRTPNPNRRNYCSDDCRKDGNALAAREYRRRQRRLHQ